MLIAIYTGSLASLIPVLQAACAESVELVQDEKFVAPSFPSLDGFISSGRGEAVMLKKSGLLVQVLLSASFPAFAGAEVTLRASSEKSFGDLPTLSLVSSAHAGVPGSKRPSHFTYKARALPPTGVSARFRSYWAHSRALKPLQYTHQTR